MVTLPEIEILSISSPIDLTGTCSTPQRVEPNPQRDGFFCDGYGVSVSEMDESRSFDQTRACVIPRKL